MGAVPTMKIMVSSMTMPNGAPNPDLSFFLPVAAHLSGIARQQAEADRWLPESANPRNGSLHAQFAQLHAAHGAVERFAAASWRVVSIHPHWM